MKHIITDYRRIWNWENFFLDSAIYSVGRSVGISYADELQPVKAVTGDLFAYMYSDVQPCDSGLTNYVFMPEAVERAYAMFGYGCVYLSRDAVNADLSAALAQIRASIDKGVPVLAWGCGGVVMRGGGEWNPLPEGCLIGGYEDNLLYVNLYPGEERLAETSAAGRPGVDAYGYTAIDAEKALATSYGIFILGDKLAGQNETEWYSRFVRSIPGYLTMPERDGWLFGKAAFDKWCAVLLEDANWQSEAMAEANCWDKHCSAYCALCTSIGLREGGITPFMEKMAAALPDLPEAAAIVPLFARLQALNQRIWDTHGGFMPPAERLATRAFREELARILGEMGQICEEIAMVFA